MSTNGPVFDGGGYEASRQIGQSRSIPGAVHIGFDVSSRLADNLAAMARKRGQSRDAFAQTLFDAAYSARCKPTGDRELDAAVAAIDAPKPLPHPFDGKPTVVKAPPVAANDQSEQITALRAERHRLANEVMVERAALAVSEDERRRLTLELTATRRRADALDNDLKAGAEAHKKLAGELVAERKRADASAKDAASLVTALNLKTEFADALKKRVAALESELAEKLAAPRIADPEAKPNRTPQQEADSLSRTMVNQAKVMWLRDEPLEAIARWAEVSPAAMRIIFKLSNSKAARA